MATQLERQQRKIEKQALSRLDDDFLRIAQDVGRMVQAVAVGRNAQGEAVVPVSRRVRDNLKLRVWTEVLKPYFIGRGESPLVGNVPQSQFMQLVVDGIEDSIRNAVQAQVALLKKYTPDDVFGWMTGRRPFGADVVEMSLTPQPPLHEIERGSYPLSNSSPQAPPLTPPYRMGRGIISEQGGKGFKWYDPFHLFVNPNGYRLSDNGWQAALEMRRAIDALLDQQIPRGTSAVRIADMLVKYLVPSAKGITTKTPYGKVGSYWARRLARTEITAAAGRATINMAIANPFVELVDWVLSLSHPKTDICDNLAKSGPYAPNNVPAYPPHPHCLCTIIALVIANRAEVIASIRRSIYEGDPTYAPLQGAFNEDWLVAALMSELFVLVILEVVPLPAN